MSFKSYSFADIKALINELNKRLTDPLMVLRYEEYRAILINAQKEIDKCLDALISPQKETLEDIGLTLFFKDTFIKFFNEITGQKIRVLDSKTVRQLKPILKDGFTSGDLHKAIKSAFKDMTERETVKHLTPEFITRPAQFSKYLNMKDTAPKPAFIQA